MSRRQTAADVQLAPAIRQRKPKTYVGSGETRAAGEFRGRETARGKQSVGARNRQTDSDRDRVRVRDEGGGSSGGVEGYRDVGN